jgi:DUF4097 and DUF4098 domain-containing protein YvlB
VEAWFKKHRFVRFIKNTAGVAAVVLVAFGGIYLYSNYDDIYNTYVADKIINQEHSFDTSVESFTEWNIDLTAENVSVKLIETSGTEFNISRNYVEKDGEVYQVTLEGNTVTVFHDIPSRLNLWFDFEDLAELFVRDEIVIELPEGVSMEDVSINTSNARVEVNSLTATSLDVDTSNGRIEINSVELDEMTLNTTNGSVVLQGVNLNDSAIINTSNGPVRVKYSEIEYLEAHTTNARIVLTNVVSNYMGLYSTNSGFDLENVSTTNSESTLIINTTNGSIDLEEVYIHDVTITTSNGGIDYYNDETPFDIDVTYTTSNGSYEGNVN